MAKRITQDNLDDSVTRHMRPAPTALRVEETVATTMDRIRNDPPPEGILYFYAVDADGRLAGVVPTRRLLLAPPERPIRDVMVPRPVAIPHNATVLEACEFFTLHRFLAFPVVDGDRRLIGMADVSMYTDELSDLAGDRDQLFNLIGVHVTAARQMSPLRAFRGRFPWLLCNIAGGILAAFLSGIFEAELQKVVALAMFIPVVLALAESVSIQSVSLALEVMRGRPPTWQALLPRLYSESITGLLLGAAAAVLVGAVAWLWLGEMRVVACLFGGIACGVTIAALFGLAVPYLLRLIARDPQVAAGPLALALADMATLLVYFNLARAILN